MTNAAVARTLDEDKLNEFVGKVVGDVGASLSAVLVFIGHRLGLFKGLVQCGPVTSTELAEHTGLVERYVREWLVNQAASGYVDYDASTGKYQLNPEQQVAFTVETSPAYLIGMFYVTKAMTRADKQIEAAFRNGGGMLWGDHDPDLFLGTELLFKPGYAAFLMSTWLPALTGIEAKLEQGGKVADIGCGRGASTILMAQAFPASKFWGFDTHSPSIERARKAAAEAGVSEQITFAVGNASSFEDNKYDLVAFFDCLHDMGDPLGAARRACETLDQHGSALIVEPMAGHTVEENFNPIGRITSAASTLCCTPNSLALGGPGLGAIATDAVLREVVIGAGFSTFERVAETRTNRVFEARRVA